MKDYCKGCGQRKEIAGPTSHGVLCWQCYLEKNGIKMNQEKVKNMEKTGRIKVFYRKNGGIVFEDEPNTWYNPDKTNLKWEETSAQKGDPLS